VLALCLFLPALLASQAKHRAIEFYVSPKGIDANAGSKRLPFATLERARDAVRSVQHTAAGSSCVVYLQRGTYERTSSFVLGPEDGGDSLAPVTYAAAPGARVRVSGGRAISGLRQVEDAKILGILAPECAGRVYEVSLSQNGIRDYGRLRPRGFGRPMAPSGLELFFNDVPMTLSRWPNDGWATIKDTLAGTREGSFVYDGDRPRKWILSPDVWLHGYWTWDWADSYARVAAIDTARHVIATAAPHGVYGYTPGKRFYALNVLEELDSPGEYYVDREKGILYFWPPGPLTSARITVSLVEKPLIVLRETRWVTIAGLTIECTRGAGIEISGGEHNTVAGCRIRDIGTVGVSIGRLEPELASRMYDSTLYDGRGGNFNGVQSCDIYACGEGGVILSGGERATLAPGFNYIDNTRLTDVARWSRTYRAAVFMWGVGNSVSHCLIHGLPHTAVFFWGNDHILEYNEVHDVCRETGDAGAFYQGRDWTQRGNVIRYNYFHDVRGIQGQEGFTDVMSVYLDDFASGATVRGNVFVNGGRTVMIGGGRENIVENNLFINGRPAVHVDARGKRGWAATMFDGENSVLRSRLRAVHPDQIPYRQHYPSLHRLLETDLTVPEGNIIRQNISVGGIWRELQDGVTDSIVCFSGNIIDKDPGFVSMKSGDYRLRDDAAVFKMGFERIPTEKIGLVRDRFRRSIPVRVQAIPGSVVRESERKKVVPNGP
jgi:hypothetical protein